MRAITLCKHRIGMKTILRVEKQACPCVWWSLFLSDLNKIENSWRLLCEKSSISDFIKSLAVLKSTCIHRLEQRADKHNCFSRRCWGMRMYLKFRLTKTSPWVFFAKWTFVVQRDQFSPDAVGMWCQWRPPQFVKWRAIRTPLSLGSWNYVYTILLRKT